MGICNSKLNDSKYHNSIDKIDNKYVIKELCHQNIFNQVKNIKFTQPVSTLKIQIGDLKSSMKLYNMDFTFLLGQYQPIFVFIILEMFSQFINNNQIFTYQLDYVVNNLKINNLILNVPLNRGRIYIYKNIINYFFKFTCDYKIDFEKILLIDFINILSLKFKRFKLGREFANTLLNSCNKNNLTQSQITDNLKTNGFKPISSKLTNQIIPLPLKPKYDIPKYSLPEPSVPTNFIIKDIHNTNINTNKDFVL